MECAATMLREWHYRASKLAPKGSFCEIQVLRLSSVVKEYSTT